MKVNHKQNEVEKNKNKTYLDTLVMEVQAESNPTTEEFANFRSIIVLVGRALQPAFLMNNPTFDDPIPDSFTNDILGVLFRVQVQFDTNVTERNSGIRK
jgi:hypothetical protein